MIVYQKRQAYVIIWALDDQVAMGQGFAVQSTDALLVPEQEWEDAQGREGSEQDRNIVAARKLWKEYWNLQYEKLCGDARERTWRAINVQGSMVLQGRL